MLQVELQARTNRRSSFWHFAAFTVPHGSMFGPLLARAPLVETLVPAYLAWAGPQATPPFLKDQLPNLIYFLPSRHRRSQTYDRPAPPRSPRRPIRETYQRSENHTLRDSSPPKTYCESLPCDDPPYPLPAFLLPHAAPAAPRPGGPAHRSTSACNSPNHCRPAHSRQPQIRPPDLKASLRG